MAYCICRVCGSFFQQNGQDKCLKCLTKDQEQYDRVREYLTNHQGASVMEVASETGISAKSILRFVDEGGFSIVSDRDGNPEMISSEKQQDKGSGYHGGRNDKNTERSRGYSRKK